MSAAPTKLADGRYELMESLGSGGMGTVYRAFDSRLDTYRAIKMLSGGPASAASATRFLNEARAMARIRHPNVVNVHDIVSEGEHSFIVMELVEGGSLADVIRQSGCLEPAWAVRVFVGVLDGLHAAHKADIIHRDIKPSNILMERDGRARLTDFGIARIIDGPKLTRTGAAMGTAAYMPPEQRTNAKAASETADVYAVGASLYQAITGKDPFDLYNSDLREELFAGVPEELANAIQRATRYHAASRYQTADAFRRALTALDAGVAGDEEPSAGGTFTFDLHGLAPKSGSGDGSRGLLVVAGVLTILLAVGGAAILFVAPLLLPDEVPSLADDLSSSDGATTAAEGSSLDDGASPSAVPGVDPIVHSTTTGAVDEPVATADSVKSGVLGSNVPAAGGAGLRAAESSEEEPEGPSEAPAASEPLPGAAGAVESLAPSEGAEGANESVQDGPAGQVGTAIVISVPSGAAVRLDGERVVGAKTRWTSSLAIGSYELELELPDGRRSSRRELIIEDGVRTKFCWDFERGVRCPLCNVRVGDIGGMNAHLELQHGFAAPGTPPGRRVCRLR